MKGLNIKDKDSEKLYVQMDEGTNAEDIDRILKAIKRKCTKMTFNYKVFDYKKILPSIGCHSSRRV